MNYPILYSFRRCPYAMRARMAITSSGLTVELREVELKNKPSSLIALSTKATVPVLLTMDNKVIDESLDIMVWSLSSADPDGWLTNLSSDQKTVSNKLITNNDSEFKYWLDRYKYANRYPEHGQQVYRQHAEKSLSVLENHLSNTRYLLGSELSIADIAIFPFIRQFYFVDPAWFEQAGYPKLNGWLQQLIESHLFELIMHKYTPWKEGEPTLTFPEAFFS